MAGLESLLGRGSRQRDRGGRKALGRPRLTGTGTDRTTSLLLLAMGSYADRVGSLGKSAETFWNNRPPGQTVADKMPEFFEPRVAQLRIIKAEEKESC